MSVRRFGSFKCRKGADVERAKIKGNDKGIDREVDLEAFDKTKVPMTQ